MGRKGGRNAPFLYGDLTQTLRTIELCLSVFLLPISLIQEEGE